MPDLPTYIATSTDDEIRQRILNRLPSTYDKNQGSFFWDTVAPVAIELAQAGIDIREALRLAFAQTAASDQPGEVTPYLDMRAEEKGIPRRLARPSSAPVILHGTPGATISAGITVTTSTANGQAIEFVLQDDVTIYPDGIGQGIVKAVVAGAAGNVPAGAICMIPYPVPGLTSIVNQEPATDGVDIEDDVTFLARYLSKVREPGTSGNIADYKHWATDVAGVGDAKILPLWNGNGTVKVVLVSSDRKPASSELSAAVADYIERVRPIGATVTVEPATGVTINIAAFVIFDTGRYTLNDITNSFSDATGSYFASLAFRDTYVSYAQIGVLLKTTPGVIDYSGLTINGSTANINLLTEGVPILGTVNLTA